MVSSCWRERCLIRRIGKYINYFQIGYNTLMLWSLGLAAVFLGLIYVGPGRHAIAVKLEKK
jgi:hypothetical protein